MLLLGLLLVIMARSLDDLYTLVKACTRKKVHHEMQVSLYQARLHALMIEVRKAERQRLLPGAASSSDFALAQDLSGEQTSESESAEPPPLPLVALVHDAPGPVEEEQKEEQKGDDEAGGGEVCEEAKGPGEVENDKGKARVKKRKGRACAVEGGASSVEGAPPSLGGRPKKPNWCLACSYSAQGKKGGPRHTRLEGCSKRVV